MSATATDSSKAEEKTKLVLITGLSGSGKSSVAKCFEDLNYYTVDNLPLPLLRQFLDSPQELARGYGRIAVVTDVRAPGFAEEFPRLLGALDRERIEVALLFLEASDEVLVRRFSETRRPHPLAPDEPVIAGIRRERELLAELRARADMVLDTSAWSIHEIRSQVFREFATHPGEAAGMVVSLVSFGFKHGIPYGSDLVFDVRFLLQPAFRAGAARAHRAGPGGRGISPPGARLRGGGGPGGRPAALPAAALPQGEPELRHRRGRLHGRTAPLGGGLRAAADAPGRRRLAGAVRPPRPGAIRRYHSRRLRPTTMIGTLILTHGGMARELLASANVIVGPMPNFEALSLEWGDCFDDAQAKIREALGRLEQGEGVLILTDMFGGTPCNLAVKFQSPGHVEVIGGVNLPMVLRLAGLRDDGMTLAEVARWLQVKGQRSICLASDVLESPAEPDGGDRRAGG